MLRRFLIATILLAFSFSAFAQKRPFTFEDMMNLKRVGDFTVSPDGHWVAFAAVDVSLADNSKQSHLWIVPSHWRRTAPPHRARPGNRRPPRASRPMASTFSSPPSATASRSSTCSSSTRRPEPSSARPRQLTTISTEADGGIWSPDGKQVLFLSAVWPHCPDDACNKAKDDAAEKSQVKAKVFDHLLYRHWNAYDNGKRSHLFLIGAACDAPNLRPPATSLPAITTCRPSLSADRTNISSPRWPRDRLHQQPRRGAGHIDQ